MSIKALFPAVFFILVSANSFAQVTGGSTTGTTPGTAGTTPGTTGTIPGTTGTIPGTAGTIPGTTGTTPGTAGTIPGTTPLPSPTADIPPATTPLPSPTTELPPATTELPPATTQLPPATIGEIPGFPDLREDNTNIFGRLGGNTLDDGMLENDTVIFGSEGRTLRGVFDSDTDVTVLGEEGPQADDDTFATRPQAPDTLDDSGLTGTPSDGFGSEGRTLHGVFESETDVIVLGEEGPQADDDDVPDTLDNGIFADDPETPMDGTLAD